MSNALEIDGKTLHPIKEAAQVVSYSRDYVTRLAREHKIKATYIGRQWFVELDSLRHYAETSALEQAVRKKQLSEERKQEQQVRAAADRLHERRTRRAAGLPLRAASVASLVLSFGVLSGYLTHQVMTFEVAPVTATMQTARVAVTQVDQPVGLQRESLPVSSAANEVSTAAVLATGPTESIEPMSEVQNGIFLFPPTATTSPERLFSDDVVVEERPDGSKWLRTLDENGQVVGNAIPFIEVPITAAGR